MTTPVAALADVGLEHDRVVEPVRDEEGAHARETRLGALRRGQPREARHAVAPVAGRERG